MTPGVPDELVDDMASLRYPHWLAERLDPTWRTRAHHRLIGREIARTVEVGGKLIVTTPPQIGKTTICAEWAPQWLLSKDPRKTVIIASYGHRLAVRSGRRVRNRLRTFGARFGVHLAAGTTGADEWYTSVGGGVKAIGLNGGVTGFPCNGAMIIDDYCKSRAEADSPVYRENTWEAYSSGLLSRMAPGTPQIVLATRWHPDDLIGRLLKEQGREDEGGAWRLIHLPALAELALTGGSDPLGRAEGDPLTHPNEALGTREALLDFWRTRKRDTPLVRDWRALYMGDPMERTGALVSWDTIHDATVPPSAVPPKTRAVVAVDPSGGGADEVGIITAALGEDEKAYIVGDASGVLPVTEWPLVACDVAEREGAERIVLEVNFGGKLVEQAIRAAWMSKERNELMPAISNVRALRGKVIRAEPIAQELAMGRVKIVAGLDKLSQQWATYRAGDRDSPGRLDASVYAVIALLRSPVEGLVREEIRTRRRDGTGQRSGRRLPGMPGATASPGGRRLPGR